MSCTKQSNNILITGQKINVVGAPGTTLQENPRLRLYTFRVAFDMVLKEIMFHT